MTITLDEILAQLEGMTPPVEPLPEWPLPQSLIEDLVREPQATVRYINERRSTQFEDRFEVGEHMREYMLASGMSVYNLGWFNRKMGLAVKPTKKKERRKLVALAVKDKQKSTLAAACEVIAGYGSPRVVSASTGVGHMTIHRGLHKWLQPHDVLYKDLKHMSIPKRQALANEIEQEVSRQLDEEYAHYEQT